MVTKDQVEKALNEAFSVVFRDGRIAKSPASCKSHKWSKRELQGYAQRDMTARDVADITGVSRYAALRAARYYGVSLREGKAGRPRKVGS